MRQLPLAALAFLAGSALYLAQALRLPPGSAAEPGPGLFPVLVGAFLVAAAATFLAQALRRPTAEGADAGPGTRRRMGVLMAALVAFCLLLPWVGYSSAAFGLLVVLLRIFGQRRWSTTGLVALVMTLASYYLFAVLLGVPLPRGTWRP